MTSETITQTSAAAPSANGIPTKEIQQQQQQQPSTPQPRRLEPLEVGWQFVQEYYTILNKDPNRLHCFYNKNSAMVHGFEGDTVKTCNGQQEIHKRFKELNLQDSKVVISNVDSLGTLSNGIIVSVIGELETKGNPARKFSQAFVLAEQPNGYYVLNDVFRFLKDDPLEEEQEAHIPSTVAHDIVDIQPQPTPVQEEVYVEEEEAQEVFVSPAATGVAAATADEETVESQEEFDTVEAPQSDEPVVSDAPVEPQQQPSAPSAPKTWAKLAETDKERWAKHVSEAKGQTLPAQPTPPQPKPSRQSQHQVKSFDKDQTAKNKDASDVAVFIRGFSKATKVAHIKETFGQLVGHVKWVDLMTESTAYVEFADAEMVKKALALKSVIINNETVLVDERRPSINNNNNNNNRRNRRMNTKALGGNQSSTSLASTSSNGNQRGHNGNGKEKNYVQKK